MNLNDFQKDVMRTQQIRKPLDLLEEAVIGMCGESGEVADIYKKWRWQGHNLNMDKIAEEAGDVLYYVALAAKSIGLTLEEIAEMNMEKRRKRYPLGFDPDRSVNRERWENNENRESV